MDGKSGDQKCHWEAVQRTLVLCRGLGKRLIYRREVCRVKVND